MTHPCDGHACDHCYLCDVVGICCATVPSTAAAAVRCSDDHTLHDALVQEACTHVGLGQLLRLGSSTHLLPAPSPLALAAGASPVGDLISITTNTELEDEHVFAPRRHQQ